MFPIKQHKLFLTVTTLALLLILLASAGSSARVTAQTPAPPIRLKAVTFTPALGEKPDIPPGLSLARYAQGQQGYYIVQFQGAVQQSWRDAVTATGAELLSYIPDFAFKVRMNPAQARQVVRLDGVTWVGIFQPAYKLNPNLARDGVNLYTVRLEEGSNTGLAIVAIAGSGAELLGQDGNILRVAADSAQLDAIANVLDVAWVENFAFEQTLNEYGAGVIMQADTANANGYDGSSQIVAVADTGLGGGTATTAHPGIPASRITAVYDWPGISASGCYDAVSDGSIDVDSGHGTHVAVSVVGGGDANGIGRGTAPAASLVFQSVEDWADMKGRCGAFYPDGYYLIGLPDDNRPLFQQAYDAGARIHSNSWGSDAQGDYTADSANADDFIWNNPDMLITFSAGNSGVDANSDGVIDNDSIGSPATAKNVLTVGASENDRQGNWDCDSNLSYTTCADQGGQNDIFTYGAAWPDNYPADPIASDPSAGNAEQMAAFSSRGPTDDGRIKPDVVAPGTWILSGFSDLYQEGYDSSPNPQNNGWQYDGWGFPYNQEYKYMGGTSMSNPLTAGAAVVVRDYYQKAHNVNASAALVKATLINSAIDMLDENNDGVNDNAYPIPNNHEGWGRVNLANATDGSHQFVDEAAGLATGGSAAYTFDVSSGDYPFKVSLVWSDYPSTESAAQNLVNDLDLTVTSPSGATYTGNVFSGGWSVIGGSADRVNNVENVYVQSAESGTWTVTISGYNVPNGPQPFALVVDAAFGPVDNPPTASIVNPTDGATVAGTVTVQVDAADNEDAVGTLTVEVSIDGGAWQMAAYNSGSGYYEYGWDSTAVADGSHTINARATDSGGNATDANQISVTTENVDDAPSVSIVNPADGDTVSDIVLIQVSAGDDLDAAGTLNVEVSIDSGAWQAAAYNSSSGYYELSWDTTTVADGSHTIDARATDSGGNVTNTAQIGVTVNNNTLRFFDDLEGDTSGWTASGLWHLANDTACVSPGYNSATHSFYYGQEASCDYDTGGTNSGTLTTPGITGLATGSNAATLSFYYWREVESYNGAYDKTFVEVSYDGGSNWTTVWYKDSSDSSLAAWTFVSVDLSPSSDTALVRFTFDSVDSVSNNFVGWLIDDVTVENK